MQLCTHMHVKLLTRLYGIASLIDKNKVGFTSAHPSHKLTLILLPAVVGRPRLSDRISSGNNLRMKSLREI